MTEPINGEQAYARTMQLVRNRLVSLQADTSDSPLVRAERFGMQVRKIVEGVAYAALSGVEHRNQQTMQNLRTMDADKLLPWLAKRQMLTLPTAQRLEPPPSAEYKVVLAGAAQHNMDHEQLKAAYGRASAIVHERHPERLTTERIASELLSLEHDAEKLRAWLWLHMMHHRGEAFLIQMGQFGTSSFFTNLSRVGDLPPGV